MITAKCQPLLVGRKSKLKNVPLEEWQLAAENLTTIRHKIRPFLTINPL